MTMFRTCMPLILVELVLSIVTCASHKLNITASPILLNNTSALSWFDISYRDQCRRSRCCSNMDRLPSEMRCIDDEGVLIEFGYCVTFDGESFQSNTCHYFQPKGIPSQRKGALYSQTMCQSSMTTCVVQ